MKPHFEAHLVYFYIDKTEIKRVKTQEKMSLIGAGESQSPLRLLSKCLSSSQNQLKEQFLSPLPVNLTVSVFFFIAVSDYWQCGVSQGFALQWSRLQR